MNRYTPAENSSAALPVLRPDRRVSREVHPPHGKSSDQASASPKGRKRPDERETREPVAAPVPSDERGRRYPTLRVALICLLLTAGATAMIWPAVRSVRGEGVSIGEFIGGGLLQGGLPPTNGASAGGLSPEESLTESGKDTEPTAPTETDDEICADVTADTDAGTRSEPSVPSESESEPSASVPDTEPDTYPDTHPDTHPETQPEPSESTPLPDRETDAPLPDTEPPATETEAEPFPGETEPSVPVVPEGCFPIVSEDRSEPWRSVGYITNTAESLPPSIPGEGTRLWSTSEAPTVLIIHSHPFEAYSDGDMAWYDPATGPLAQTDSQMAPNGVVALGAKLTRALRDAGVTVIHLRVPVAEGESAGTTYDRTEEMVRYYCRLYPDIGLVLDLRRSAELTDDGAILRTEGRLDGQACAQVRLSVSAGRESAAVSRDIAVAVALRRALWEEEPTISRPVWAKSGQGMAAEMGHVARIGLEVGAAGNTFEEAARLVDPLARALAKLVLG